ncbi:MAG: peptidase T, partial [Erysipelotrichaceae bacterium]
METMLERFIRYAKVDTRSDEQSITTPSTMSQVEFAKKLAIELKDLGFKEAEYHTSTGFVTATLSSNISHKVPTIGWIAHYDLADYNSVNINPQIINNYDGQDIILNKELNIRMEVSMFPKLLEYVGHTLITTDGTTLLGADDKAGVVEIIEAGLYLLSHPNLSHGEIRIAFGPDEEIGRGADKFDAPGFRADFAYTMDGGGYGELEYESFNAAKAVITLKGVSVHPGGAKDKLINAAKLAFEFDGNLPANEVPEKTEHYEGFYLLLDLNTNIEEGKMDYIVRDHDKDKFLARKQTMLDIASRMNQKYQAERVIVELSDQYYNMKEVIEKDMRPVDLALQALKNLNIESNVKPIRGGTDGSKISFLGIP